MKCLLLENNELTFCHDMQPPEAKDHEALIQVMWAGICGTDLELIHGYYPFTGIPGHEFVGRIVSCASRPQWTGKRVVADINIACNTCPMCAQNNHKHCQNRQVLGLVKHQGVFSEYVAMPVENLYLVPDTVSNIQAVFAEPLAAALLIMSQVKITTRHNVLLIGAGRLGQLIALAVSQVASRLKVVVRHDHHQQILSQNNISCISQDMAEHCHYDIVIDASGSRQGFDLALECVKPGGTIVLKSTFKGDSRIDMSRLVVEEITLIGSRCGDIQQALDILEKKSIAPQILISDRFALKDFKQAFARASQPGALKILFEICKELNT